MKQKSIVCSCSGGGQRGWRGGGGGQGKARANLQMPPPLLELGVQGVEGVMFFKELSWPVGAQLSAALSGRRAALQCALCSRFSNEPFHFRGRTCSSRTFSVAPSSKTFRGFGVNLKVSGKVFWVILIHLGQQVVRKGQCVDGLWMPHLCVIRLSFMIKGN